LSFLEALGSFAFLQQALVAGLLASIGCAVMGSYVVLKRITFLAGGIAHAVLGGMGVAYYFGAAPLAGAMASAVVAALLIGWIRIRWHEQEDILIGALWAAGMALGLVFISRTPGYSVDLMSYLFGNILLVSRSDLWLMAVLDAVIVLAAVFWHRQFMAVCFDEEYARTRGVPVTFFYLLLLTLVSLTVVLLIRVVGLILVIALLTIPAAIAVQFAQNLRRIMMIAGLLGAVFNTVGLAVSFTPDLPAGASIVLVAASAYIIVAVSRGLWHRQQQRKRS
jgi:zinc transport system permease protein